MSTNFEWSLDEGAAKRFVELASSSPAGVESFDGDSDGDGVDGCGVVRLSAPTKETAMRRARRIIVYFIEAVQRHTITYTQSSLRLNVRTEDLSRALDHFASKLLQRTSGFVPYLPDDCDEDGSDGDEDDDDYEDENDVDDYCLADERAIEKQWEADENECQEEEEEDEVYGEESSEEDNEESSEADEAPAPVIATPVFDELFPPVLGDVAAIPRKQLIQIWKIGSTSYYHNVDVNKGAAGKHFWRLLSCALDAYVATTLLEPRRLDDGALARAGGSKDGRTVTAEDQQQSVTVKTEEPHAALGEKGDAQRKRKASPSKAEDAARKAAKKCKDAWRRVQDDKNGEVRDMTRDIEKQEADLEKDRGTLDELRSEVRRKEANLASDRRELEQMTRDVDDINGKVEKASELSRN